MKIGLYCRVVLFQFIVPESSYLKPHCIHFHSSTDDIVSPSLDYPSFYKMMVRAAKSEKAKTFVSSEDASLIDAVEYRSGGESKGGESRSEGKSSHK